MASFFERQKAFREHIRISAEWEEFTKFLKTTSHNSAMTQDELYARFLSQRETEMFEERKQKMAEAACEKQKNHNMLTDFETVGDELNLSKFAESKKKKWREAASKKYSKKCKRNKLLRNKLRILPKRSVKPPLHRQSKNVRVLKLIKYSSQPFKIIQAYDHQKLKSEQDIQDAPIITELLKEQLPDDDDATFQVCYNM